MRTLQAHPRLLATDGDIEQLRTLIHNDSTASSWYESLYGRAEKMLDEPPSEYEIIGPRMLHISRQALLRIVNLGLMYRISGERRFADRAIVEMTTVCGFSDWNPDHFLDAAEMTHAVAIGYDWLYDLLTPDQRVRCREAILTYGLREVLPRFYEPPRAWAKGNGNWTQVCNSGMGIGALAIADEEPELADTILGCVRQSIPRAFDEYSPDGGWIEGPTYWVYATQYSTYLLAALNSSLQHDFGLSDHAGLAAAGEFRIYSAGPTQRVFNYADAGEKTAHAAQMFWMSRHYGRPHYAWFERTIQAPPDPWCLMWYHPGAPAEHVPLDKAFRRIEVAFFRSAWNDPDATFVGFKGGSNRAHHCHFDLGAFVLDALGHRWVQEMSADDYNLPGWFDYEEKRWSFYRAGTIGHNTLLLNGENQSRDGNAPLLAYSSTHARAFGVTDLTSAYPAARRVWRGIALLDRVNVLVEDEIESEEPVEVVWQIHTPASIALDGAAATLRQKATTYHARILAPEGVVFDTASTDPGPPQNRNEGISKLIVRVPDAVGLTRIAVLFSPDAEAHTQITPLREWKETARNAGGESWAEERNDD